jgi:alpha-D-xyloside xylohydrolase
MLGPDLLVAPVFSESGAVEFWLPAGEWVHLLSGEKRQGPAWFRESYDFRSLPLFVRPGALIPMGSNKEGPDYDWCADLTVVAGSFIGLEGKTVTRTVCDAKGKEKGIISATCRAGKLETAVSGSLDAAKVKIRPLA